MTNGKHANGSPENTRFQTSFVLENNALAAALFGEHNSHLQKIENWLGVSIKDRANQLTITGRRDNVLAAEDVLETLYNRAQKGKNIETPDVEAALRFADNAKRMNEASAHHPLGAAKTPDISLKTPRRDIYPRTIMQAAYIKSMLTNECVFGIGPAGTGKTYLAAVTAVHMFQRGEVDRIILCRPAVEAGERLGFLPGDMKDKVDPYLRPLYDALHDTLDADKIEKFLENGTFEVAPLAFMRGRTLSRAFVILDEAQNTTSVQMKMFLTRLGEDSRMVITGDITQIDLPTGTKSGLVDALETLENVEGLAFTHFTKDDIVRHKLVNRIVDAYERKK